jgi:hypothetical protein
MIRYRFSFAVILLVFSLVFSSGVYSAAAALLQNGTPPACCDNDPTCPATPAESPGTAPGCECISCLSFILSASPSQPELKQFPTLSSFCRFIQLPPPGYVRTIDYPPEFA